MKFINSVALLFSILGLVYSGHEHVRGCRDSHLINCGHLLHAKSDMCTNSCFANLCQHTCGVCSTTTVSMLPATQSTTLQCYKCTEMNHPGDCNITVPCPGNQSCIISQTFTPSLEEKFQSGCVQNTICQQLYNTVPKPGSSFTRSIKFDGGCCASNLCNRIDPDVVAPGRKRKTQASDAHVRRQLPQSLDNSCVDFNSAFCKQHASYDICQVDCFADICPEACQKCVTCFNCEFQHNPGDCGQMKTCKNNEICITVESMTANFQFGWKQTCASRDACEALGLPIDGQVVGNASKTLDGYCCSSPRCNYKPVVLGHSSG